jgi:hypothetical protein
MPKKTRCVTCGHQAGDKPTGSYDILLFKKEGWKTFGPIKDGVCRPCLLGKEALEKEEQDGK